jgi:hypothetical protein
LVVNGVGVDTVEGMGSAVVGIFATSTWFSAPTVSIYLIDRLLPI